MLQIEMRGLEGRARIHRGVRDHHRDLPGPRRASQQNVPDFTLKIGVTS